MNPDFYYECEVCKTRIPATFDNPTLPEGQEVVKRQGIKSETTFRCAEHRVEGTPG